MDLRLGDFGLAAKLETVEQRKKWVCLSFILNHFHRNAHDQCADKMLILQDHLRDSKLPGTRGP